MKRILIASFVLLLAMSVSALAQAKKPIARQGLVNAVKINGYFDALKAGEWDKVNSYFTDDYTFTDQTGKMASRDERLRAMKEQGPIVVGTSDITTRIYGDAGVVTGLVTTKAASGGTEQIRFIQVWVWQKGDWFIAAAQATPVK